MSNIKLWSTTPASNNSSPPQGAPEGMAPSTVNDIMRQQMSDHRTQWEEASWFDYGYTISYVAATQFKFGAADRTALAEVSRRVRAQVGAGTIYGLITASSYSAPDTTVTVSWDSGSLDASLSGIAISIISFGNSSIPPFKDTNPIVAGSADPTKKIRFEVDTNVPTGTTVVLTPPAASGTVPNTADAFGRIFLNDYISGFALTNNGTAGFDVAAGMAADSSNAVCLSGSAIANKTQAAWVVGTAAGGKLHAAAMANNTWYYWYALWKTTDGTIDYGFDVATTPTLPAGYSKYRYIGARKTQAASTNWDTFIQHGDEVFWSTPPALDINTTNPGTAAVTATINVPAVKVRALLNVTFANNTPVTAAVYFSDPAVTDIAASVSATPLASAAVTASGIGSVINSQVSVWTNASSQIRYRSSASDGNFTIRVVAIGWIDPRGKPV